jgi:hypothetical protein
MFRLSNEIVTIAIYGNFLCGRLRGYLPQGKAEDEGGLFPAGDDNAALRQINRKLSREKLPYIANM